MQKPKHNRPPGLIIAANGSNCGKTTISAMLLAALRHRQIPTQPYKIGADFFDPGLHCVYSQEISRNLDTWIMGQANVLALIDNLAPGYCGLIEAWGGVLEHKYPDAEQSCNMEIAQLTDWPIILIISCLNLKNENISEILKNLHSIGSTRLAGVILNRIQNEQSIAPLLQSLSNENITILGQISEQSQLQRPPQLHNASSECTQRCPSPEELAQIAEQFLDLDAISALISPVPKSDNNNQTIKPEGIVSHSPANSLKIKKRIAISHDQAFFFYYQGNSEFLNTHGVEIVPFSPLADNKLPDNLDGLILSGGIPEDYAPQLTENNSIRQDIQTKVFDGLPCYAECGGLMYLSHGIRGRNGEFSPMLEILPGSVELSTSLQHFGYALCHTEIAGKQYHIRGHEYHYSRWLEESEYANLWTTTTCATGKTRKEGYQTETLHASFVHLYFPSAAALISNFFKLN